VWTNNNDKGGGEAVKKPIGWSAGGGM